MPKIRKLPSPVIIPVPPDIPKSPRVPSDVKPLVAEHRLNEYLKYVEEATAAGEAILPYEEELIEEEDLTGCESEDLLVRKSTSFTCFTQVALSSSSLLRSVEYNFPPVEDPGLDAALNYRELPHKTDDIGYEYYLILCKLYRVVPLRRVQSTLNEPVMNLKYYGLRRYHMKCLAEALKTNRYVETFILENNQLCPKMAEMLGQMLERNTKIKTLNLKLCYLGPTGIEKLAPSLALSASITNLDLSYNNLGVEGMKKMVKIVKMPVLAVLNLSHNNLLPKAGESIERILLRCTTLTELDLSWNRLGSDEGYESIFDGLAHSDNLTVFNLSNNGCCLDPGIFSIFAGYLIATTKLEKLDLSWNRIPPGKFIRDLRKGIAQNKSLIHVNVSFNPWLPNEALPLANALLVSKTLEVLDMDNIWFNKKIIKVFLKARVARKTLIIGGIYQNWIIKGPDWTLLIWSRVKALFAAPKRPDQKQDFGNFLYFLPDEPMRKKDFEEQLAKKKYVIFFKDPELFDHFYAIYTKDLKLDITQMKKDYFSYFPGSIPQPIKGKERKINSSTKVSDAIAEATPTSPIKTSLDNISTIKASRTPSQKSHVSVIGAETGSKVSKEGSPKVSKEGSLAEGSQAGESKRETSVGVLEEIKEEPLE